VKSRRRLTKSVAAGQPKWSAARLPIMGLSAPGVTHMQQILQKKTARLALALGAAVLATGCVAIPGDPYYDNGGSYGYGGAPGYYPGTSAVTVYEQPGVIYTAPPPGWRAEAWREHQWREARERDRQREIQRNERERRD